MRTRRRTALAAVALAVIWAGAPSLVAAQSNDPARPAESAEPPDEGLDYADLPPQESVDFVDSETTDPIDATQETADIPDAPAQTADVTDAPPETADAAEPPGETADLADSPRATTDPAETTEPAAEPTVTAELAPPPGEPASATESPPDEPTVTAEREATREETAAAESPPPDEPIETAEQPPDEPTVTAEQELTREEAAAAEVAAASDETADDLEEEEAPSAARTASDAAMQVINWVRASGDNGGLPFVIIDKASAEIFVFDADSQFLGATPALLGSAQGDDSAEGVGDKKLSAITPDERTTPAGRFLAKFGSAGGKRILWVDYATAISLHPVVTANKTEHRLERLVSASPEDNRITYGCINVSANFYEKVVRPLFEDTSGVVYILPETRSLDEVFPTLHAQAQTVAHANASTEPASAVEADGGDHLAAVLTPSSAAFSPGANSAPYGTVMEEPANAAP